MPVLVELQCCYLYVCISSFLPKFNIAFNIFSLFNVQDLPRSNVLYGYRIDGPRDWGKGHRFDSSIVLVDPYAKLIEGRRYFGDISMKLSKFLGTYDFDSLPFDWGENYKLPNIPEVRCFTCINDSCCS